MNVGQLKKFLEDVPDETVLVVTAPDHSYRETRPQKDKADVYPDTVYKSQKHLAEHFGEKHQLEGCEGAIDVLVFDR